MLKIFPNISLNVSFSKSTTTSTQLPSTTPEVKIVKETIQPLTQVKPSKIESDLQTTTVSQPSSPISISPPFKMTNSPIVIIDSDMKETLIKDPSELLMFEKAETTTSYNSEEDRKDTENAINQIIDSLQFDMNLIGKVETTTMPQVEDEATTEGSMDEDTTMREKSGDLILEDDLVSKVFVDSKLFADEREPLVSEIPTTTFEPETTTLIDDESIEEETTMMQETENNIKISSSEIMNVIDKLIEEHKASASKPVEVLVEKDEKSAEKLKNVLANENMKIYEKAPTIASSLKEENLIKIEPAPADKGPSNQVLSESFSSVLSQIYNEDPNLMKVNTENIDISHLFTNPVELDSHEKFNQLETLSLMKTQQAASNKDKDEMSTTTDLPESVTTNDKVEMTVVKETSSISIHKGKPTATTMPSVMEKIATTTPTPEEFSTFFFVDNDSVIDDVESKTENTKLVTEQYVVSEKKSSDRKADLKVESKGTSIDIEDTTTESSEDESTEQDIVSGILNTIGIVADEEDSLENVKSNDDDEESEEEGVLTNIASNFVGQLSDVVYSVAGVNSEESESSEDSVSKVTASSEKGEDQSSSETINQKVTSSLNSVAPTADKPKATATLKPSTENLKPIPTTTLAPTTTEEHQIEEELMEIVEPPKPIVNVEPRLPTSTQTPQKIKDSESSVSKYSDEDEYQNDGSSTSSEAYDQTTSSEENESSETSSEYNEDGGTTTKYIKIDVSTPPSVKHEKPSFELKFEPSELPLVNGAIRKEDSLEEIEYVTPPKTTTSETTFVRLGETTVVPKLSGFKNKIQSSINRINQNLSPTTTRKYISQQTTTSSSMEIAAQKSDDIILLDNRKYELYSNSEKISTTFEPFSTFTAAPESDNLIQIKVQTKPPMLATAESSYSRFPPSQNTIQAMKQNVIKNSQMHQLPHRPQTPVELSVAPKEALGLTVSTMHLDEDLKEFSQLCNDLAFSLWKSVMADGISMSRSVIVSPFALSSYLSMIFLGARGQTSGEMNELLRLDEMVTFNPHIIFKNITDSVEQQARKSGIAAATFVRELYSDRSKGKLLPYFKEKAQQFYGTHVEEVNFNVVNDIIRRRTNLLVKRHTHGKINEYLKVNNIWIGEPLAAVQANVFMVSRVFQLQKLYLMHLQFQTDCSVASVSERDGEMFFQVSPAIRQRRLIPIPAAVYKSGFTAGYDPELDATAVAFGNANNLQSTILVMPGQQGNFAPGDNLERLEKVFMNSASPASKDAWNRLLTTFMDRPGLEVQIPRFSHRSLINVTSALQQMGLKELFTANKADLTGLTGSNANDLFFSDMIQINQFTTCGEEKIADQHHIEIYPSPPLKRLFHNNNYEGVPEPEPNVDNMHYKNLFYDPIYDSTYINVPLPLRPRQARLPENPRLRFDRPFLYFVRHNPTGIILFMGRFNPRLLP